MTKEDSRVDKLIRKASGVIGKTQDSLEEICRILEDKTHSLSSTFDSALIERSGRTRAPKSRTVRYSLSFVPVAIGVFNNSKKRMLLQ